MEVYVSVCVVRKSGIDLLHSVLILCCWNSFLFTSLVCIFFAKDVGYCKSRHKQGSYNLFLMVETGNWCHIHLEELVSDRS